MKQFILKILLFVFPAFTYTIIAILFMPYFLSLSNGPSTKEQITYSFENASNLEYELLILGNSRTYRGINPERLSIKSFNFSHDNDSYNQIYYKLKYLIDVEKDIKYLILGLDYFQFSFKSDTRNYVYADFLDSKYMDDFEESSVFVKIMDYYFSNINPKKILSLYPKKNKPFLRENGQYIKPSFAKETDTITRDMNRLEFQIKYFEKTLSLCNQKNIKVFIVNLPTRQNELKSYTNNEINEFDNFIKSYVDNKYVFYLNFSKFKGFTTKDYTDITHFNENAANHFTEILNKKIMEIIDEK
jgi:RNase H-fold protein (predicted Holliday junction resolvase)